MAFSSSEGKLVFKDFLIHMAKPLGFTRFLDIGAGAGLYCDIIREVFGEDATVHAIEAYKEYIFKFGLLWKYDLVLCDDIRNKEVESYDLIIMGDVLEHLPRQDAVEIVNKLRQKCKFLWVALPVKVDRPWSTGYNQHPCEWEENPWNQHLHEWTGDEIVQKFKPLWLMPFIQIGCFLVEGNGIQQP